jgi:small subunit ribosomal protein S20
MANIKSQIKRIGTNKKAQERNKAVKSELKTVIRSTREAIAAGDAAKAVSKGVIHANQAANRKSAIASQVAGLGAPAAKPAKAAPKAKAAAAAK